jgi:hypothetical protein
VSAEGVQLTQLVPAELLLQVVATMIIIEEEIVDRGAREQTGGHVVPRFPNVHDDFLSVRIFEKLNDLKIVDDVQAIPVVDILFEQEKLHLLFVVDLVHVLLGNAHNGLADLSDAAVQIPEILSNHLQQLDQET